MTYSSAIAARLARSIDSTRQKMYEHRHQFCRLSACDTSHNTQLAAQQKVGKLPCSACLLLLLLLLCCSAAARKCLYVADCCLAVVRGARVRLFSCSASTRIPGRVVCILYSTVIWGLQQYRYVPPQHTGVNEDTGEIGNVSSDFTGIIERSGTIQRAL